MLDSLIRLIKSEVVFQLGNYLPLRIRKGPLKGKRFLGVFFYNRRSEEWNEEERIYHALQLNGCTVIEAGAHIGLYSVLLSQQVGKEGRVYAIEPNPVNYRLLRSNLNLNACKNVVPIEAGAGATKGRLTLIANRYSTATGTFKPDKHERLKEKRLRVIQADVPIVTIDEIIQQYELQRVDFVKIDTEGFEPDVIRGMKNCLSKYSPLIYFEIHGMNTAQKTEDFTTISTILQEYGYTVRICAKDFPIATAATVQARGGCACLAYRGSRDQIELARKVYS